jgi:hypothetical protein
MTKSIFALFDRLLPSQKEQEEAATGDLPEGTQNSSKEIDAVGERVKVYRLNYYAELESSLLFFYCAASFCIDYLIESNAILFSFHVLMPLPACRYTKGAWSECNTATNQRSRSLTLKKGDSSCEQSKTITKKCKKGQSPFIDSHIRCNLSTSFLDVCSRHQERKNANKSYIFHLGFSSAFALFLCFLPFFFFCLESTRRKKIFVEMEIW